MIDLKNVRVASPCPADWDSMTGDDRVRHCAQCDLDVYNFSAMTEREVQDLLANATGRLCGRFYRRADGTMLTQDCPVGASQLGRRLSRAAVVLVSTLMAASLSGCATRPLQGAVVPSQDQSEQSHADLMLKLVDQQGAAIADVKVALRGSQSGRMYEGSTNDVGELRVGPVVPGEYVIEAEAQGFKTYQKRVALDPGQTLNMKLTMKINEGEMVMVGVIAYEPLIDTDTSQLGRTFSSREITDLPHR